MVSLASESALAGTEPPAPGTAAERVAALAGTPGAPGAGAQAGEAGSAAALERAVAARQELPLAPGDGVLLAMRWPDAPADELLWPLSRGARLILPAAGAGDGLRDGAPGDDGALCEEVLRALGEHQVHTLRIAPGLLQQVLLAVERGLQVPAPRRVICADEPLGHHLEARCLRLWPQAELWAVYRHEGVGDIARRRCRGDVPAGRDVAGRVAVGQVVRIIDDAGLPCPVGIPGEVALTGPGLAGGAERRTGDRGRFREDGTLELLGAVAEPTLRGGVRIPRGEVVAALVSHAAVGDARVAVTAVAGGEPRLAAYVTPPADADARLEWDDRARLAQALRAHAQRVLPGVLVPESILPLDAFPLAGTGQVDAASLPAAAAVAPAGAGAPRSRLETALLSAWCAVLGRDSVSVHDNFFLLGGHSLLAIQLMATIRRTLGLELPVSMLYRYRSVADLAARIATLGPGDAPGARSLVHIQPGAGRPALALVHPAGGGVFCYASLASALTDRPVYAFEARRDPPSLEAMAAAYLGELDAADGTSGCVLGGWSLGGVVAFEMGRQRAQRGGPVGPLILIDSFRFTGDGDTALPGEERALLGSFVQSLMSDLGLPVPALPADAGQRPARQVLGDLLAALGEDAGSGLEADEVADRYHLYRDNMRRMACYRPARTRGRSTCSRRAGRQRPPRPGGRWRPALSSTTSSATTTASCAIPGSSRSPASWSRYSPRAPETARRRPPAAHARGELCGLLTACRPEREMAPCPGDDGRGADHVLVDREPAANRVQRGRDRRQPGQPAGADRRREGALPRVKLDFHLVEVEPLPGQRRPCLVDRLLDAEDHHRPARVGPAGAPLALGRGADRARPCRVPGVPWARRRFRGTARRGSGRSRRRSKTRCG